MKGKAFIPLVLGLVVGLFAVKLVIDTVRKSQANQPVEKSTMVRAKSDIRAYDRIAPENIEEVQVVDSGLVPKNQRVESIAELKDRVAIKPIPAGAPVLKSMLAPPGAKPGLIARIPTGYRAVAVKIDESTMVGYSVQPGDFVDVIVVMDVKSGTRTKETIAEVLLQRVEVGAIGQGVAPDPEDTKGGKVKPAKTATLIVKEEDSPKLHLAATRGKITLSLRGEDEKTVENMPSASTSNLLASLMGLNQEDATPSEPAEREPVRASLVADRMSQPRNQPFDVVVRRGSNAGDVLETITFENKNSSNIIGVTRGAAAPAASLASPARPLGLNEQQTPGPRGPYPPSPFVDPEEDQDFTNNPRE